MKEGYGKANSCKLYLPNRTAYAVPSGRVDEGSGRSRYYYKTDKSHGMVLTIAFCRTLRKGAPNHGFPEIEFYSSPSGSTIHKSGANSSRAR